MEEHREPQLSAAVPPVTNGHTNGLNDEEEEEEEVLFRLPGGVYVPATTPSCKDKHPARSIS